MALSSAERSKRYAERHPERRRESERRWREANKERYEETQKQGRARWRAANPEKDKEAKLKWRAANRDYNAEYQRRLAAANPEEVARKKRNIYLKRAYKITLEQYEAMATAQGNKCAICGGEDPGRNGAARKHWVVDHCHNSNQIRGLLCHPCNVGLGHFRDNESLLLKAIDYLRSNK